MKQIPAFFVTPCALPIAKQEAQQPKPLVLNILELGLRSTEAGRPMPQKEADWIAPPKGRLYMLSIRRTDE